MCTPYLIINDNCFYLEFCNQGSRKVNIPRCYIPYSSIFIPPKKSGFVAYSPMGVVYEIEFEYVGEVKLACNESSSNTQTSKDWWDWLWDKYEAWKRSQEKLKYSFMEPIEAKMSLLNPLPYTLEVLKELVVDIVKNTAQYYYQQSTTASIVSRIRKATNYTELLNLLIRTKFMILGLDMRTAEDDCLAMWKEWQDLSQE